jgi:putative NIF3 family GTP cyclohydrolase 1 type 2
MDFKTTKLILIAIFFSGSLSGQPIKNEQLSANQIIDLIKKNVTCSWSTQTVDTFKSGNPDDIVTGVAVCMFADMKVLKQAVDNKCNLIIAHEPTFYSHLDETKTLENDPVYQEKIKYINDNKLIIWRFHDHIHRTNPDGIYFGMIQKLGWRKNQTDSSMVHFKFEKQKLSSFISGLKLTFPGSSFRVIGNPNMMVTNVAFSAGAPGSETHRKLLQEKNIDLLVAGEAPEWETYQYVYDAQLQGKNKAVIFLGHAVSEADGMNYCARWLKGFLPKEINIQFIESGSSYTTF